MWTSPGCDLEITMNFRRGHAWAQHQWLFLKSLHILNSSLNLTLTLTRYFDITSSFWRFSHAVVEFHFVSVSVDSRNFSSRVLTLVNTSVFGLITLLQYTPVSHQQPFHNAGRPQCGWRVSIDYNPKVQLAVSRSLYRKLSEIEIHNISFFIKLLQRIVRFPITSWSNNAVITLYYIPALDVSTSLRPSRSKPWARWTGQLANSLPIWEEQSSQPQAMTEKELFRSREFRCWCNAITLSCYMTSFQSLTARTDDLYPVVSYLNFKTPLGTYREFKNTNKNSTTILAMGVATRWGLQWRTRVLQLQIIYLIGSRSVESFSVA